MSVTPASARAFLERHNLHARKGYGQHFLVDGNTVRKIVRLAEIGHTDDVIEIGPGIGALTHELAAHARTVIAVEIDVDIAKALAAEVPPNVQLRVGDALKCDLAGATKLVSNLPYNVATPIMARVLDAAASITDGLVMVQRELGDRWVSPPGSKVYGAISVKFAYHCTAKVVARIPPSVFLPPPKVDSVLVQFRRHDPVHHSATVSIAQRAFAQRRKTIRNTLPDVDFAAARVAPSSRPEQLSIDDFSRLAEQQK